MSAVLHDGVSGSGRGRILPRAGLIGLAALLVATVAALAGARFGLMLAIGLGIGMTLEGLRFGFAGPWRAMILRREPAGILAQLLAIGIVAIVALPLIASNSGELVGAEAPIGFAMIGGAFVFGAAMQVVMGCGSGTLIKKTHVGSGFMTGASEYIREIEDYPSFLCSCFFVASHFKPHKRDLMNNMSHKFPTLIFNF